MQTGLKLPMKNPGTQSQLGGEFVFHLQEDSIDCIYASRMTNTRNHSPLSDVFAATGVDIRWSPSILSEMD